MGGELRDLAQSEVYSRKNFTIATTIPAMNTRRIKSKIETAPAPPVRVVQLVVFVPVIEVAIVGTSDTAITIATTEPTIFPVHAPSNSITSIQFDKGLIWLVTKD